VLGQGNLNDEIGVGGAPSAPCAIFFIPIPNDELVKESTKHLQRGSPILKAVVDLAAVEKPVVAPEQAPVHTVGHLHPPKPQRCSDWAFPPMVQTNGCDLGSALKDCRPLLPYMAGHLANNLFRQASSGRIFFVGQVVLLCQVV
jgi:hypothetical protein